MVVYHFSELGARSSGYDAHFGIAYNWDMPIVERYPHKFPASEGLLPVISELWHNYDVILIYGYTTYYSLLAFLLARLKGKPILFVGESNNLCPRPLYKRFIKRIILYTLFRNLSAFLYIGTANKEYYKNHGVWS